MALEVKVYKEISAYDPKVMWGMSWRQMFCVAIMLPVAAATYFGIWYLGNLDLAQWVTVFVVIPFALIGWVRPKGLRFEQYARYVIAAHREQQVLRYEMTPVWSVDKEVVSRGHQRLSSARRRRPQPEFGY